MKNRKNSGSPGQLEGLSKEFNRQLNPNDRQELIAQYEKINAMLNNSNVKLPDGGAKLKAKLESIQQLLNKQNSTSSITDKVFELSLNDKPDIRKESVLRSTEISSQPTNLLRAHPHSTDSTVKNTERTRTALVMSLEESMKLQDSQQKDIKLANMKKRMESVKGSVTDESITDDLTLIMNRLRLDSETHQSRPEDDDSSDETDSEEEEDSDDDASDYERYEDEGFEEDE